MVERMKGTLEGSEELNIGIVVSRWNSEITDGLFAGAQRALTVCGIPDIQIVAVEVPGAFEIPIACKALVGRKLDAIIALGCVVKGETAHFEYISNSAIEGIRTVSLESGIPISCGILTTYTYEQALTRAGADDNNKGSEAALSAIETATLLRAIQR